MGPLKGSEYSVERLSIMDPALILQLMYTVHVYRPWRMELFCLFWFSLFGNGANPGGDGDADWSD